MSENNAALWLPLESMKSPWFAQNLTYLSTFDPILYKKIQLLENRETLLIQQSEGLIRCRTGGELPRWVFGESSPRRELAALQNELRPIAGQSGLIILLGSSAGYALQCLLPAFLRNPEQRLLLIEPSASRIALGLNALDARPALASGRLHFAVTEPGLDGILAAVERFNLWEQSNSIVYPTSGYPPTISPLDVVTAYRERSKTVKHDRIELVERLRNQPPKPTGAVAHRVLLVDFWPGAPQNLHIRSIHNAMHARGMEADIYPMEGYRFDLHGEEYRRLVKWNFLRKVWDFQPDLIISYAYHAPHLLTPEEFEALRTPWVQVVSNLVYFDRTYYPGEYSGIAERRLLPAFKKRGASHSFFLPIMANYVADCPTPTSRKKKIVFVGNSLELSTQDAGQFLQRIRNSERLRTYVQIAERELDDFDRGNNLFDYLDTNPVPDVENEKEYHEVFRYLLCQSTGARRRNLLESIAGYGLALYGNWSNLPAQSPLHGCLKGVLPFAREPELFQEGHIFLNIHTVANVTSPNMRFFNAPGMGGFMIGDGDFSEYLTPGSEYIRYASRRELVDAVRYYLERISEADEIRQRALDHIRRQWTYGYWVDWVLREIGSHK